MRPLSVMPVAKIQTRNSSHVGTSESARSWPLNARKTVNMPPTPPISEKRQTRERCRKARIDDGHGDQRELRHDPDADHHPDDAVPQSEAKERRKKDHEAGGHRGFARGAIDRVILGPQVEQLVEKSEIDAEVVEHGPRDERGGGENELVIGREYGRQKDREEAGQAQHRAIEKLAIAALDLVIDRLPQIDARESARRKARRRT